ncbi:hypothetical protein CEXT_520721 [Caerostris extrusa]|uniref:Integrase catalytic domain-containing protein n=1 Tax=Caerostris extrusa TaxID=172846 RepID=A0AAV4M5J6_CAEEX|nr:hypothetical protein CEXT_520721 [Caerostris extrusa]
MPDQGRQFESQLFLSLDKYFGFQTSRTTAYHGQSNGLFEQQHITIKAILECHLQQNKFWVTLYYLLPWIDISSFLGLGAALKGDIGYSSAEGDQKQRDFHKVLSVYLESFYQDP